MSQMVHPRHGLHDPTTVTPARTAGSIRRTLSTDMVRPGGPEGVLHLSGRARDLYTAPGVGRPRVVADATMAAVVDYPAGQTLVGLIAGDATAAQSLIGASAGSGFRGRMKEAYAAEAQHCTPLHLLLDDIPVCVLISGHAIAVAAADAGTPEEDARLSRHVPVDVLSGRANQCAGFADSATIMLEVLRRGRAPVVTGPVAPRLEGDDPWGWHEMPDLAPGAMRRRRRLDVTPAARADGSVVVELDAMFRDSYLRADGTETIIHEYELAAVLNPDSLQILSLRCTPRVLPWVECPSAAASGERLVGQTLHDLRALVRADFYGTTTCTHLNDALRSLEDVTALAALVA
ncbi:DUF2889 domain-containing protein [uncultured Jatrophihabitans sp.]|uniref:DUF2889 domain-containing protein n=1 Tax=uncultured Jatrophihabitans sp. TaxID=1610747 RepID=UPI0035CA0534